MTKKVVSISHYVNHVKVEQRVKDGFVNATAMCLAHGKAINYWFENKETFKLFVALADSLSLPINYRNSGNSYKIGFSATKYAKLFPELLVVKRGSPEFGGGTWIHPDLAIQLAQWCNKTFALQVSRWIREWFIQGFAESQKVNSELQKEYQLWLQRRDIRFELKDVLRPELMEVVVAYAKEHCISPYKLCSQVHDLMNKRIQGHKSKELKALGNLPLGDLIRDYFDTKPLVMYSAINKLAKNSIIDKGLDPLTAIDRACDDYLGKQYLAKPYQPVENLYLQGQRLTKKLNRSKYPNSAQLSLFSDIEAI